MSNFDEVMLKRLTSLEREVERLRVKESLNKSLADTYYLAASGKAVDADKLDGIDSTGFAAAGHGHDHGALTGLADNDHPQYVLASAIGQWAAYTPVWTASTTNPTLGNGSLIGRYCVVNKLCTMSVKLVIGSTTTLGTGNWAFSIPLPMIAGNEYAPIYIGTAHCRDSGIMSYVLAVYLASYISTTKTAYFVSHNTNNLNLTPTVPFAWATADNLTFEITYELA